MVLLACVGALNPVTLHADAAAYEGQTITSILFEPTRQPLAPAELNEILPLKMQTPFHVNEVRKTIERLFATGRYQDIAADVEPYNGGVAVKFITKNSWFIGRVAIEGDVPEPPNNGQMVNATRLQLGQPFDPTSIPAAEEGIKKALTANGFYESTLQTKYAYDDAAQQVNITFQVHEGKRARFTKPELRGTNLVLPENRIVRATKWRHFLIPGYKHVTQTRVRQGVESVRLKYENSGRLLATVSLASMNYDHKSNTASAHLNIDPGPEVEIKAVGAKVRKKKLRQNVPVYEEHTVDRDLLTEGERNLRDQFQSDGYFEAEVEFKEQRLRNNREEIDYIINLGKRHRFVFLQIDGNKYFTKDTIRERMYLAPKSFEYRRGRYSEVFRRRDEETIINLYKSNGFRDVSVSSRTVDDYNGKTGDIGVFITINEGAQWFVSKLDITGPTQLDLSDATSKLSSTVGQPFSEFNVATDRDTITTQYFENGFPNATFEWSSKPGSAPNQMELTYAIVEGQQQFTREVLLSGLRTTRPRLINRNILLAPGDPLSPIRMAETQKRLYDLGVFAQVDMAIQNPDGATRRKYVLFEVEEAKRYSVTGGFGAEFAKIGGGNAQADLTSPGGATGVSPRVSLDVSRINFLGLGHTLSFRSRFSSLQKRGLIDYLAPRIFGHDRFDLSFTTLYDDSHDVRTFSAQREEASVQLTERISKPTTAFYRFSYRNVHVGTLKIDPLLLPHLSQSVRVGMLSGNLVQDRRDDPTDAHKGIYNTIDVGFASSIFGSQVNFTRLLGRNATYHRIGKKLVLAREIEVGLEPAFNSPANADPSDPIPLPERFFGGGGISHRGFPENQAGPRDLKTGFPLGGSSLLFNKTELRFPLLGANIAGVIFHDMGNVYSRFSDISFRFKQRDLADFNYMVHAVGFGIRYRTPIGPVRLDLAYSINSPRFNGFTGTYGQLVQCSIAGNCVTAVQRVSHFQFFFSIGQTF